MLRHTFNPAAFIKTDGTSTTTAEIPFAAGILIEDQEKINFGGTDVFIRHDNGAGSADYMEMYAADGFIVRAHATQYMGIGFSSTGVSAPALYTANGIIKQSRVMYIQDINNAMDGYVITTHKDYPSTAGYTLMTFNSTGGFGLVASSQGDLHIAAGGGNDLILTGSTNILVEDLSTVSADMVFSDDTKTIYRGKDQFIHSPSTGILRLEAKTDIEIGTDATFEGDVTLSAEPLHGTGYSRVGDIVRLTNITSTNINAAASNNLVDWSQQDYIDTDTFTHDTVTNNSRLAVDVDGKYNVTVSLGITSTGARQASTVKIRLNGSTTYGYRGKTGYIRAASGHDEASLHLSVDLELSAGDYIEVLVDRESTLTTSATLVSGESLFQMRRIQ